MLYVTGSLLFVISFVATIPQLYQTLTTRETRDLNLWNLILNLITNILLIIHTWIQRDTMLFSVGVWYTFYWLTLLSIKLRNITGPAAKYY